MNKRSEVEMQDENEVNHEDLIDEDLLSKISETSDEQEKELKILLKQRDKEEDQMIQRDFQKYVDIHKQQNSKSTSELKQDQQEDIRNARIMQLLVKQKKKNLGEMGNKQHKFERDMDIFKSLKTFINAKQFLQNLSNKELSRGKQLLSQRLIEVTQSRYQQSDKNWVAEEEDRRYDFQEEQKRITSKTQQFFNQKKDKLRQTRLQLGIMSNLSHRDKFHTEQLKLKNLVIEMNDEEGVLESYYQNAAQKIDDKKKKEIADAQRQKYSQNSQKIPQGVNTDPDILSLGHNKSELQNRLLPLIQQQNEEEDVRILKAYKKFQERSQNILALLARASKNIFNRDSQPKFQTGNNASTFPKKLSHPNVPTLQNIPTNQTNIPTNQINIPTNQINIPTNQINFRTNQVNFPTTTFENNTNQPRPSIQQNQPNFRQRQLKVSSSIRAADEAYLRSKKSFPVLHSVHHPEFGDRFENFMRSTQTFKTEFTVEKKQNILNIRKIKEESQRDWNNFQPPEIEGLRIFDQVKQNRLKRQAIKLIL